MRTTLDIDGDVLISVSLVAVRGAREEHLAVI